MLAVYFLLAANKFLYSEGTKTPNTWYFSHFAAGRLKYLFHLVFLINFLKEKIICDSYQTKVVIEFSGPLGLNLEI